MATVKFYIERESKNAIQITAVFTEPPAKLYRFDIPTGEKVIPKNWNKESQRCKSTDPDYIRKNKRLLEIELKVMDLWDRYRNEPGKFEEFKTQARAIGIPAIIHQKKTSIYPLLDQFIEEYKQEKDKKTVKTYITLKGHLMDFSPALTLDDLTFNWDVKYRQFLNKTINDTSAYKDIKKLKCFLKWASRIIQFSNAWQGWKTLTPEPFPVPFTLDELHAMENLLVTSQGLRFAQAYISVACRTSARISNIKQFDLKKHLIDNALVYFQKKGANSNPAKLVLPLDLEYTKPVLKVLKSWNGQLPEMAEQKLNKHIKDLAEIAGITHEIEVPEWKGNQCTIKHYRKCDYVSLHTGRATFISLAAQQGVPDRVIMTATGIRSFKTLQNYLHMGDVSVSKKYLSKMAG